MLGISPLVSVLNWEFFAIPAFLLSAVIVGGIGTGLSRHYSEADPPGKLEGMVTAVSAWAVTGVLGGLTFLLIAWTIALDPILAWANTPPMNDTTAIFLSPPKAVFEGMSGFTGTGLTLAAFEEEFPRSNHW